MLVLDYSQLLGSLEKLLLWFLGDMALVELLGRWLLLELLKWLAILRRDLGVIVLDSLLWDVLRRMALGDVVGLLIADYLRRLGELSRVLRLIGRVEHKVIDLILLFLLLLSIPHLLWILLIAVCILHLILLLLLVLQSNCIPPWIWIDTLYNLLAVIIVTEVKVISCRSLHHLISHFNLFITELLHSCLTICLDLSQ